MKTNDIITASELTEIINAHGAGSFSIDGSIPEQYTAAADLELDNSDRFQVVINYNMPVQFHLLTKDEKGQDTIDGEFRAMVTTGLVGRCEGLEWVA